MKKFRFRLETVQRVRQIQHDVARGELLTANHHLAVAARAFAQREQRATDIDVPTTVMTSETFARHRFSVDSAFNAMQWAANDRDAANTIVAQRREEWITTHTALRAVERLHDRARDEYRSDVRKESDRLADEITTTRFRERSTTR